MWSWNRSRFSMYSNKYALIFDIPMSDENSVQKCINILTSMQFMVASNWNYWVEGNSSKLLKIVSYKSILLCSRFNQLVFLDHTFLEMWTCIHVFRTNLLTLYHMKFWKIQAQFISGTCMYADINKPTLLFLREQWLCAWYEIDRSSVLHV